MHQEAENCSVGDNTLLTVIGNGFVRCLRDTSVLRRAKLRYGEYLGSRSLFKCG